MALTFAYGTKDFEIDVTLKATELFLCGNLITVPVVVSFNDVFMDVSPGIVKTLFIRISKDFVISIAENRSSDFVYEINPKNTVPFWRKTKETFDSTQRKHFLTYGDKKYVKSLQRICKEAWESEYFHTVIGLNQKNLPIQFCEQFATVLQQSRGGGYWIWKPFLIKQQLDRMNDNDVLVYCDAGCTVNKNGKRKFEELISMINQSEFGIIGFDLMIHPEQKWTNEKVFEYFNVSKNDEKIRQTSQIMASIIILRKCKHTVFLIEKWIEVAQKDALLFTDHYNDYQKNIDFVDHRHDQSIFSILRKKYGCVLLNDNTFTYNWDELHDVPFLTTRIRE